jgi:ankyrin repeat protein
MLTTNHLSNNVAQPPQASQTAVDFLAFKLHVSLLLNFCTHLHQRFPDYLSFMKMIAQNTRALEQWLTLSEAAQFRGGIQAVTFYANIIQIFVANEDSKRPEDYSILNFAAHLGYSGVITHMLEEGAAVNILDRNGSYPLHSAAKAGHEECVRLLVRAGALLNREDLAVFRHAAIVNVLLDEGALQPKDFPNVLFIAAQQGNIDTVELLIARGVRLDAQNADHNTALMIAAQRGHMSIVHALINAKASLVKADKEGRTALHLATAANHAGVVHVLLQARAKLKLSVHELSEAMLVATHHGNAHLIPAFILAGANPNTVHESGETCLLWAAGNKQPEVVNALLRAGANPNIANARGFTPLMEATFKADRITIVNLLRAGALINTQNSYGSTALMWAVEKGDEATVNTLIRAGADLTLTNARGETALTCAQRFGQPQLLPMLKRGTIRQFYRQLLHCRSEEVESIIEAHRRAGVSKGDICQFMLASETHLDRKISLLQYALATNTQGRPSNGLSKFMHHSQGRGFRTFFCREPSYAISRIKTELYKLQAQKARSEVDTSPKLL